MAIHEHGCMMSHSSLTVHGLLPYMWLKVVATVASKKKYTLSSGCTNIQCGCGVSTVRGSTSMAVERGEEEVPTIGAWQLAHDFTGCDEASETFLMGKSVSRTYWSSSASCWWCAENILRLPGPEEHNNNASFCGNRHINKEITYFSSESNCYWNWKKYY